MSIDGNPNILYILADDLGWGDVGCHGSPARTPSIDRLVAEGTELTHHYVCPVCTPTRASLLSGRHPGRFGAHATVPTIHPVFPDGHPTLASRLRDAGYDTGIFGKWHLGASPRYIPNHWGFGTSYGCLAGCLDPYTHRYHLDGYEHTWHRNGEAVEEPGHATDLIAREAIRWIESREREQPWFCYVPFTAVHEPVKVPQDWLNRYSGETYDADPAKDRSFKKYAAYTSHMDHAVGQLIEALESFCQRANTLVVFTSDNGALESCDSRKKWPGYQENEPRLGTNKPFRGIKGQLYEGGMRTPTAVSWQGVLPGSRTLDVPMHAVDWLPTLLDMIGEKPPETPPLDGVSLWPVLNGDTDTSPDRRIYWSLRHKRFALFENGWKLIARNGSTPELYNLTDDPYETTDLAAEEPDRVARMREAIEEEHANDDVAQRSDVPQD